MIKRSYHGQIKSRAYNSWRAMIERCENPNHSQYLDYGGRGITVCKRWRNSFPSFLTDMGHPPEGCSLDRIKGHLGYSPTNCRWSTRKCQARNKRNSRLITANGKTQTLAAWAEETGLSSATLITRIDKYGWSAQAAVTATPGPENRKNANLLTHNGRTQTVTAWAREVGISKAGILYRLKIGKTVSQALTK